MVVFGQTSCILGKVGVFGQGVVFGQKWFYSGERGCIRAKVVVFGQKWLYSGKNGCIPGKWLFSGKSGGIRAEWLYSGKNWLYSG